MELLLLFSFPYVSSCHLCQLQRISIRDSRTRSTGLNTHCAFQVRRSFCSWCAESPADKSQVPDLNIRSYHFLITYLCIGCPSHTPDIIPPRIFPDGASKISTVTEWQQDRHLSGQGQTLPSCLPQWRLASGCSSLAHTPPASLTMTVTQSFLYTEQGPSLCTFSLAPNTWSIRNRETR